MTAGYGTVAETYAEAGWVGVLPLPHAKKKLPPTGFTGKEGGWPTAEQRVRWAAQFQRGNVAIRLPRGVVGLDFDRYKPEGEASYHQLVEECGPLPPTWTSTSRTDGSGILLFTVPDDVELATAPRPGMEVVQFHHRYAVCWPSVHDSTGEMYQWISPDGERNGTVPQITAVPALPAPWLQALTKPSTPTERRPATSSGQVWSPSVERAFGVALRDMTEGCRHDTALRQALVLARFEEREHPGAGEAIDRLGAEFVAKVAVDRGGHEHAVKEWRDTIDSARSKVSSTPASIPKWEEHRHELPAIAPRPQEVDLPPAREVDLQPDHGVHDVNSTPDEEVKWLDRVVDGRTWLTTGSEAPDPLWGTTRTMLWAAQQPLVVAGPQGAGKTVFGQRLCLGYIGVGPGNLLGLPIQPQGAKALYLASDRPDQARLSMRRMVTTDDDLDLLAERLAIWPGPPPADLAKNPEMLLMMANDTEAQLIVIDSLKDVALKLSDDDVGSAVNNAIQRCIARGVEVIALHHPRKLGGTDKADRPRSLDDLYGSYWLTAGAGSVLYLHPGEADTYNLLQFKTPIGEKAELTFLHDLEHGNVTATTPLDITGIVEAAGADGITSDHIARCLYRLDAPEAKHRKAVARKLRDLESEGLVEKIPSGAVGRSHRWRAAS